MQRQESILHTMLPILVGSRIDMEDQRDSTVATGWNSRSTIAPNKSANWRAK